MFMSEEKLLKEMFFPMIIFYIISMALSIPYWSAAVRRLHDAGHSGWWFLMLLAGSIPSYLRLIPGISPELSTGLTCICSPLALGGLIVNIIFWCQPSVVYNKWGAPAKPTMMR